MDAGIMFIGKINSKKVWTKDDYVQMHHLLERQQLDISHFTLLVNLLQKKLLPMFSHWAIFRRQFERPIHNILQLMVSKVKFCEGVHWSKLWQIVKCYKNVSNRQLCVIHYDRTKKQAIFIEQYQMFKNNKQSLRGVDKLNIIRQMIQQPRWYQLFRCLRLHKQRSSDKLCESRYILNNFQRYKEVPRDCLKCIHFLCKQVSIFDPNINQQPLSVFPNPLNLLQGFYQAKNSTLHGSAKSSISDLEELLYAIGAYCNAAGGVILIGMEWDYEAVRVSEVRMSQKEKRELINHIRQLEIQSNKEKRMDISLVPVRRGVIQEQEIMEVIRVSVIGGTEWGPATVNIKNENNKMISYFGELVNGVARKMVPGEIYEKLFKRKYQALDEKNPFRVVLSTPPQRHRNYKLCQVADQLQRVKLLMGAEQEGEVDNEKFRYYTLFVTPIERIQKYKEYFVAKAVDVQLCRLFQKEWEFNLLKTTILIRHNIRYQKLKQQVDQMLKEKKNQAKPKLIAVTLSVQFNKRLSCVNIYNLYASLEEAKMKMNSCRYLQNSTSDMCIIQASNKMTSIFIYMFFRDAGYKNHFGKQQRYPQPDIRYVVAEEKKSNPMKYYYDVLKKTGYLFQQIVANIEQTYRCTFEQYKNTYENKWYVGRSLLEDILIENK